MPTDQIIYICVSLPFVALVVFLGTLIKPQKGKNAYLLFWSFLCFFFHISTMYVSFFENGATHGNAYDNQLFPIYFCNFVMYTLLAVSVWGDRKTKLFQNIATFTAWGGIFGALITLFVTPPGWPNYYNVQSALSHTCLLIGSLYLFFGKYIKLNVYNLIPFSFGILSCGVVGGVVIGIYKACGASYIPNAMYLLRGPDEAPGMHGGFFALAMIGIIFVITVVYEQLAKKDANTRWYKSIEDINLYLPIKKVSKE